MIHLERISKTYVAQDVETLAINSVSLDIGKGEFIAVTGPSGGGKSTLLNILGLLDTPTGGEYWLLGEELSRCPESRLSAIRRRHGIGFVFQNFHLIDDLTVEENVAVPLLYRGVSRAERTKRVQVTLEHMGIAHRSKHSPRQLSGGQQQRVAIARAIVFEPALLLADEPTGNLDSTNGNEVVSGLSELAAAGTTVVMVTHFEGHAQRASRKIHLVDGSIVSDARPN